MQVAVVTLENTKSRPRQYASALSLKHTTLSSDVSELDVILIEYATNAIL